MSVYVVRKRGLDWPYGAPVVAEITVTYPPGTSLALVRQQLDRAYLDALDDIASEEVA